MTELPRIPTGTGEIHQWFSQMRQCVQERTVLEHRDYRLERLPQGTRIKFKPTRGRGVAIATEFWRAVITQRPQWGFVEFDTLSHGEQTETTSQTAQFLFAGNGLNRWLKREILGSTYTGATWHLVEEWNPRTGEFTRFEEFTPDEDSYLSSSHNFDPSLFGGGYFDQSATVKSNRFLNNFWEFVYEETETLSELNSAEMLKSDCYNLLNEVSLDDVADFTTTIVLYKDRYFVESLTPGFYFPDFINEAPMGAILKIKSTDNVVLAFDLTNYTPFGYVGYGNGGVWAGKARHGLGRDVCIYETFNKDTVIGGIHSDNYDLTVAVAIKPFEENQAAHNSSVIPRPFTIFNLNPPDWILEVPDPATNIFGKTKFAIPTMSPPLGPPFSTAIDDNPVPTVCYPI